VPICRMMRASGHQSRCCLGLRTRQQRRVSVQNSIQHSSTHIMVVYGVGRFFTGNSFQSAVGQTDSHIKKVLLLSVWSRALSSGK